jgi:energy-coupling factor transporter ATP-binding protein EcfA2
MSRHLLYLVGQPGSGKSTLAAHLTRGIEVITEEKPFARRYLVGDAHMREGDEPVATVVELGAHRDKFSGTDALPMNVQPKVVQWLRETESEFVFGEGDRLANDKFFRCVVSIPRGWFLHIAYLAVPASVAEERRAARAAELGVEPQDPSWVKGRVSKARNLVDTWGSHVYRLNATRPVEEIAAELCAYDDPVVAALDAARRGG